MVSMYTFSPKPHIICGALIEPAMTPLREYRAWPHETKINIYWAYYYHNHRNMNLMRKKKHLKPTNVLYCKKSRFTFKIQALASIF